MPRPTPNRIVSYRMPGGETRPAIIVKVNPDHSCSLRVFTDGDNEGGIAPHQFNVAQGEADGCWDWPQLEGAMSTTTGAVSMEQAKLAA